MVVNTEEIISKTPANSGEELYSTLNHIPDAETETVETDLPGELKANTEGLIHYQGPVEITAIAGEITAARAETSEVYWLTDGQNSYWIDEQGELRQGDNHRIEEIHRLGQKILEPEEKDEELNLMNPKPGLLTSGPLQYIPQHKRQKLRKRVEQRQQIDMMEYAEGLNEETGETAESMARELNKVLRRKPEYEPRNRKGTQLIPE